MTVTPPPPILFLFEESSTLLRWVTMTNVEAPVPPPPADTRFDTAKARLTRRGIRSPAITDTRLRRILGWETLIVLAVFPLPYVLTALVDLATHISSGMRVIFEPMLVPNEPGLSVLFGVMLQLSAGAGAAVVVYLLARSGEGVGAIGLGGRRLRMDIALVMVVWLCAQVIPQAIGAGLVRSWGLATFETASPGNLPLIIVGVAAAVCAGIVEEIVVLGYLVRRLEQRGWSTPVVVIVAVAVRVSYHLYYGAGVLPIILWATASVLLYLKIRRLLPFIICHVVWDVGVTVGQHSHSAAASFLGLFFLTSIVLFVRWRKWHPEPASTCPTHVEWTADSYR